MSWEHPPKIVQIDITSQCNLACRHCRASVLDKTARDMSYEHLISLLKNIHSFSPQVALAVAGGEPLMRSDLKYIFKYIKNNLDGMSIELLTNATLINLSNLDWLLESVSGFNISMEGASANIHDEIRGKGAFNKTVAALKLLVKNDANIAVRMTYFGQGEDEPEKLMRFIRDLGIEMFNFRYLVPVGRASNVNVDSDQYRRLSEKIWDIGKEIDLKVGFSDPFPEIFVNKQRFDEINSDQDLMNGVSVTGCSIAFTLLYINPEGIVQLCPYFPIDVADTKNEDIQRIWFDNELLKCFRYSRSLLEGKCGDCEYKYACGGCRGSAASTNGFLGEDPRCWKCNKPVI